MTWRQTTAATAVAAMVAAAMLFSTTRAEEKSEPMRKAELGSKAPDFELKDLYGKPFKLSEFKDKIVVLEWLNRECPVSRGCHKKGVMQDLYKKYAGKGVVWLGIDTTAGSKPEANRVYAAEMQLAYPILHDVEGKVGRAYGAKTTPHMYVIDKKGVLVYQGAIDKMGKEPNYVADALDDVLAGKTVRKPKTDPYGCGVKYPD